ncbi:hypothetical protein [Mycobacterium sp. 48b]|uniref:hypothetical protein n=1 Tax=Mycobacterium sp. 48b TaxID=3400426 RepID=UPI003AB08C0F
MSTVARPTLTGPVMLDDITDLVALLGGQIAKPGGDEYLDIMAGPGAWPEFDESVFDQRKEMLSGIKSTVTQARVNWDAVHAAIFNGLFVWVGGSASAASTKSEQHSKAMQEIENQLAAAIEWCANAWSTTRNAKKAIADFIWLTHNAISDLLSKDYENDTDKKDAENAAKKMAEQAYLANKQFLDSLAESLSGKIEEDGSPPSETHAAAPLDNGTEGSESAPSAGSTSGAGGSSSASPASGPTQGESGSGAGAPAAEDADPGSDKASLFSKAETPPETPAVVKDAAPGAAQVGLPTKAETPPDRPADAEPAAPGAAQVGLPTKAETLPDTPATVLPTPAQPTPGRQSPTTPVTPSVPSAPSAPSASPLSSAASSLPSAGSPSSSAASPGAGIDPSKAAGQAPIGGAPTDPLQAFSQGFADSAGTPVHAASSGGAPPPLAPSPVVPASDAMTPASTTSAPLSQAGTQATAAPVQAPPAGGSMGGGMGMGGMPLGPPPTPPPAAPVAPAAAPPPAVAPPANVAGGAQVAPIPVSAARAERDAAQNAAKRSSDPLALARTIAAALNAPDMVNLDDFNFYWITALTTDGQIVVANSYGLAYIPAEVHLPAQVKMASADESIPPADRASWATYPIVALQRWAQHHEVTLRAVIGCEHHFTNSDSGVHQVVLAPEDIPAKGKMAGRDRLQVIAPDISMRLAGFSDADLVKILPPAPADTTPPADHRPELWDKVWQPLASSASNRGQVHLQAFLAYAAHAQEYAVYEAHTAVEAQDQRRAVSDFIYWQHVGQLIADALADADVSSRG